MGVGRTATLRLPETLHGHVADYAHATGGTVQDFVAAAVEKELKVKLAEADPEMRDAVERLGKLRERRQRASASRETESR